MRPPAPQFAVASPLHANAFAGYAPTQQQSQHHQKSSRSPPQSGSPVSEDGPKPSLPSISNLLGIADGERSSQDHGMSFTPQPEASTADMPLAPQSEHFQQDSRLHGQQQAAQPVMIEPRQRSSYPVLELSSSQRTIIPPTPPLRNDSVVEGTHSPSTISTGSSLSGPPYFLGSAINNIEADHQRAAHAHFIKRHSVPSQPNTSPYNQSPYATSPYNASPGALSSGSYYSPTDASYPVSNLYHQRPLPSNFPPQAPQAMRSTPNLATTNPWEHHHYISPSSQATFPQSQDRYICQTCNKAFSRPSSLKIHSHSHTGEKPFKCQHGGCGKAFSVRSNMKRHERGCHGGSAGHLS